MGVNPTPLPIVNSESIKPDDVEGSFVAIKASFDNILSFLERIREAVFDSSTSDSLGASLQNLAGRAKDTYTFQIGTPKVPTEPAYSAVPLDAVADGTVVDVYVKGQAAAKGTVTISVTVGGTEVGPISIATGGTTGSASPSKAIAKRDSIVVKVTAAPDDPGLDDCVVMVSVT